MTAQEVFTVFYAIIWGTLANALPRWKAFDTGRCLRGSPGYPWCRALFRLFLSLALLTIAPILYYGFLFMTLRRTGELCGPTQAFCAALGGVAPLGFYRLWLVAVQLKNKWFYPETWNLQWSAWFPALSAREDLRRDSALGNFVFALLYLGASWFSLRQL